MNRKLNQEVAQAIAEECGVSMDTAAGMVGTILGAIRNGILQGRRIELRGLGVFAVKTKRRGVGRVVRNGTPIPIPDGLTVRFRASEGLRKPVPHPKRQGRAR